MSKEGVFMKSQSYGILDIAKFFSALLVIAIHCAPFIEVNEAFNLFYVQVVARLAVPFFFTASGWLFFRKIDPKRGMRGEENVTALKHYWKRIFKLYLVWSILYLPLLALHWIQGGFDTFTLIRLLRDVLLNGTYYHLWFFPALLLGVPIVYCLYTSWNKRSMLWVCGGLYVIGMLINVYGNVLGSIPFLGSVIHAYESIFVTSRNGLFFAPLYLVLGIYAQDFIDQPYKRQAGFAFLFAFVAFCIEAWLLVEWGIMHDLTSMYLMLAPTVFFLFIFLLQFHLSQKKIYGTLRKMSLLLYVSHIYFIYLFLNVLHMGNLIVYALSIGCSCVLSLCMINAAKRYPKFRVLM